MAKYSVKHADLSKLLQFEYLKIKCNYLKEVVELVQDEENVSGNVQEALEILADIRKISFESLNGLDRHVRFLMFKAKEQEAKDKEDEAADNS